MKPLQTWFCAGMIPEIFQPIQRWFNSRLVLLAASSGYARQPLLACPQLLSKPTPNSSAVAVFASLQPGFIAIVLRCSFLFGYAI